MTIATDCMNEFRDQNLGDIALLEQVYHYKIITISYEHAANLMNAYNYRTWHVERHQMAVNPSTWWTNWCLFWMTLTRGNAQFGKETSHGFLLTQVY